jgi:anti-anti-sigma regulatory factor
VTRDEFAQTIGDAILAAEKTVNLDLSGVTFMGSGGLNVLAGMYQPGRLLERLFAHDRDRHCS